MHSFCWCCANFPGVTKYWMIPYFYGMIRDFRRSAITVTAFLRCLCRVSDGLNCRLNLRSVENLNPATAMSGGSVEVSGCSLKSWWTDTLAGRRSHRY